MAADPTRRFLGLDAHHRSLASDTLVVVSVVLAVVVLLAIAWFARQGILWLIAGGFLAFSIDPLVQLLRTRFHLGRGAGISLAFLVVAAILVVVVFIVVPPVVNGAKELSDRIPSYVEQLQQTSVAQSLNADQAIEAAGGSAQKIAGLFTDSNRIADLIGAFAGGMFALFMLLTFTIYFLVYGRGLRSGIAGRLRPGSGMRFSRATAELYEMNKGYWYGKFLIAAIAGLTCWVGMTALGLPYAAPLSVFVAITDLIPNIGATIGTIPVAIVGLLTEPWKGVVITLWLILYQQVENNVITPKVFKRTVDLHPFVSLVAVTLFGMVFGLIGTLLAIPVVKAVQIVVATMRGAYDEPLPAERDGL